MTPTATPSIGDYVVRLDVDFAGLKWTGTVETDASPGPETRFDVEGLTITGVRENGRPVPFEPPDANGALTLRRSANGAARLAVGFAGEVDRSALFGLYRSRHGDGYLLTTHCEPTGARRVFPCIDRPDAKARIHLTVRAPAELEAVSNAAVAETREADGKREWVFHPTPPMSTYLFYLGLGRFDRSEDRSGRVTVRVLTPPGRGASGRFAAEAGARILRACEEYYGIPYPLPKLDLIAVAEHAFGAMENWGAITFQETRLLVDGASASFARRDVFETIAHEVAHQWFGNLVTMRWWNDIWLNESFASLMETMITDRIDPSLDAWADFFLRTAGMGSAIDGDSLRSTHPIRATVERPEDVSQIFDEISYGKGSSVLAMMEGYLGADRFRAGVNAYLERFRFGNASTEDLWASLEEASGEPVAALAGPWIDRPGVPVVTAHAVPDGVELSQRRFQYLGSTDAPPWPIPLTVDVDGRRERLTLDGSRTVLRAPTTAAVHLNPAGVGFYRVLYDGPLADRLRTDLLARPATERWAVLSDLVAFLASGEVLWPTFVAFVRALAPSEERLVVEPLASELASLALAFPTFGAVQTLARTYLAETMERIGIDRRPNEPGPVGVLRDRLAFARVRVDEPFARSIAERFAGWADVDPDLRSSVAIAVGRVGGETGYRALEAALNRAGSDVEALRLERGLVWSGVPGRVRDALDRAASGGVNRSHVLGMAIQAATNPHGRAVAWGWLQENVDRLNAMFHGSGYLPLLFEHIVPVLGLDRPDEVRSFFAARSFPEGTRGMVKGLERLAVLERLRANLADGGAT